MLENSQMENESEREAHEDSDNAANENGGRLTEESDMDQSDDPLPCLQATHYVEQGHEEMGEVRTHGLNTHTAVLYSCLQGVIEYIEINTLCVSNTRGGLGPYLTLA